MNQRSFDFKELLSPLEPALFLREYWQRSPVVVARQSPDHYAGLFSVADVERVVGYGQLKYSQLKVARAGSDAQASQAYHVESARTSDTNGLFHSYAEGESIVFNFLPSYWEPAARLCAAVEQWLQFPAGANAYVTPRNACGFPPHFDAHEAFILQTHGSKHWRIYRRSQRAANETAEEQIVAREELGEPIRELDLHAGDLLYIPRGYVHEASTLDSSSIHVTLGVRTYTLLDLLNEVLAVEGAQNPDLRTPLAAAALEASLGVDETVEQLERVVNAIELRSRLAEARARLKLRLIERLRPLPTSHLQSLDRLDRVGLDTRVAKRAGMLCHVARKAGRAELAFPGNRLGGAANLEPALRFLADVREPFTVRALPDTLSDESKLVLVKRAIREGLLELT